jgi:hypothetical protein
MIIVSKFSTAFSGLFILNHFLSNTVISSMRITKQNLDFIAIKVFLLAGTCHGVFGNLAMFFWE